MRIVLLIPDCGEGGLFQFYNQLVPELARLAEVHVIFASPTDSEMRPSIAGATCHKLLPLDAAPILARLLVGPLAIAPQIARALAAAFQAWDAALALSPDCVEVCDWPLGGVPAILDGSVPLVLQAHGSMAQIASHDPAPGGDVEAMLLRLIEPQVFAHAQVVQTSALANASFWEAVLGRSVTLIRPAFALGGEPPSAVPVEGPLSVFGRLQAWKGPKILAAALEVLKAEAPVCNWYGSAKPWPETNQPSDAFLAAGFPKVWGSALRFHGPVARASVADLMSRSRAIIVPSTWDVFNFTAIEAMAAARPVLVSSGAGASDLIEDGVNGFKFEGNDNLALADALRRLQLLEPAALQQMGNAARETVKQELDPARIAGQRMECFLAAIRDHSHHRQRPVSEWLRNLLTPGAIGGFRMTDFLGTLPARPMLASAATRLGRKLLPVKAQ